MGFGVFWVLGNMASRHVRLIGNVGFAELHGGAIKLTGLIGFRADRVYGFLGSGCVRGSPT